MARHRAHDPEDVAEDGYAVPYTYPPNVAHADEIVAAAGTAREHNLGLWSACGGNHVRSS